MTSVAAGSRLLLHTPSGTRVLRSLRDTELGDAWSIPVVADVHAVGSAPVTVELPTDGGLLRVEAHVVAGERGLDLVPAAPGGPLRPEQRRENVRAHLDLGLRAALLGPGRIVGRPTPLGDGDGCRPADVEGTTIDASGGGLAATLDEPTALEAGVRLHVELDLPGGRTARAEAVVVGQRGRTLRARFHDMTVTDRELLVRLVFARQRAELAARRAIEDAAPLFARLAELDR